MTCRNRVQVEERDRGKRCQRREHEHRPLTEPVGDRAEDERTAHGAQVERAVEQRLPAPELSFRAEVDQVGVQCGIADPLRRAEQNRDGDEHRYAAHQRQGEDRKRQPAQARQDDRPPPERRIGRISCEIDITSEYQTFQDSALRMVQARFPTPSIHIVKSGLP